MTDLLHPSTIVALQENSAPPAQAGEPLPQYPDVSSVIQSSLPFSPVVQVGNLLFVSGQASVGADGAIIPDTFEGEVRRTIENVRAVLRAAGSDLNDIVQARAYLADAQNWNEFNTLYKTYFHPPYPARTTLVNCLPSTIQFEMDCIAVVRRREGEESERLP